MRSKCALDSDADAIMESEVATHGVADHTFDRAFITWQTAAAYCRKLLL